MLNRICATFAACFALALTAGVVQAQDSPLVCSVTKAVECDDKLHCGPLHESLITPTFLHVDAGQGAITILAPAERRGESTVIQAASQQADHYILGGMEDGKGWSMVIDRDDRSMTLTISDEYAGFVAFGHCVTEGDLSP